MSNPLRPHGLQPTRLLHPRDFPGKSPGVGCQSLLHLAVLPTGKIQDWNELTESSLLYQMFPLTRVLYMSISRQRKLSEQRLVRLLYVMIFSLKLLKFGRASHDFHCKHSNWILNARGEKTEIFQKSVSTEHTFFIWVKEGDSEVRSFYGQPQGAERSPLGSLPPTCTSWSRSSWCTGRPSRAWGGRRSSCTAPPLARCPLPAEAARPPHHSHHWQLYHGGSRCHFLTASACWLGYCWNCGCWKVIPGR